MSRLLEASTLSVYSELATLLAQRETARGFSSIQGSFTEKTVRGRRYLYFQHTDLTGRQRQVYLGPADADSVQAMRQAYEAGKAADAADPQAAITRLARQLHASGIPTVDPAQFKVLARLTDSGLFQVGAVLIGTQAFNALAPSLGVAWDAGGRTSDIDFAASETLAMALPVAPDVDVPSEIESLRMGFFPIPALSLTQPSTAFKSGRYPIQLDFLTPETTGSGHRAVQIPRLGLHAETLLYLDYLLEGASRLPLIGQSDAVLANVPDPGRFAVHKLITASVRGPAFRDKAVKDARQARELLEVLLDLHPGVLTEALEALARYRQSYTRHFQHGLERLASRHPDLVRGVLERLPLGCAAQP